MLKLAPTTYQQRQELYSDVESLISPGFLTHPVRIKDQVFHMRSLGEGDVFMLRMRTHGMSSEMWKTWVVASSVWMIGGHNMLGQDHLVPHLVGKFQRMGRRVVGVLFSIALGLWKRYNKACRYVEYYVLEEMARYRWRVLGTKGVLHSGMAGVQALGLNHVQRVWKAHNEMRDENDSRDFLWSGFKFVASTQANKAVRKIEAKEAQQKERQESEIKQRLDEFFYQEVGLLQEDQPQQRQAYVGGQVKSVAELQEEMRRWVEKDYDEHDLIVLEYKNRIRAKQDQEDAQRAEYRRQLEERMYQNDSKQPIVALTLEQMTEYLASQEYRPGVSFLPEDGGRRHVYERYLKKEPDAGNLTVQDGRVVDKGEGNG